MKSHPDLKVYGDQSFRGSCPTEAAEQITFFNSLPDDIKPLALHVRNEGKRTHAQAMRHKAEGMLAGAPDIIVLGSPPLLIELKRKDHTKSRWQTNQVKTLLAAQSAGCTVCVALGYEAALEALNDWRNNND